MLPPLLPPDLTLADIQARALQEAAAARTVPGASAAQRRRVVERQLVAWLDEQIEGGPVLEAASDALIRLVVGLVLEGAEQGLDAAFGFLGGDPAPATVTVPASEERTTGTGRRRSRATKTAAEAAEE